ncbi:hypothetical protein AN964_09870 [Heyndrickxia shackletonii]|uniref:Uncharacterized protein n=1 Tax=Heyndrickxia shackletonii TaxID=157838 RepID=A0A0Q3TJS4_9BACI|nr:hypothetical protein [Heyndrickxia shackletonii]KQL53777.1 hypothetical protein AN964_09870 [Heyndrickxia shackletonii]NEY99930.1 hypothetical protein [Heyndrickxia shackletonii]
MDNKDKPHFKIGDTVVILKYGTVGKISNIRNLDGQYYYEINDNGDLFKDKGLVLLSDFKGEILAKEQIDIEYKFFFGDLVQVKGYLDELFKVVGFRTEIWRYKEDAWEDIIYELTRVTDGEWLEADENELILVAESDIAESYLKKYGFIYPIKKTKKPLLLPSPKDQFNHKIDSLLDMYNDYKTMYIMFSDSYYIDMMDSIKIQLSDLLKKSNNKLRKHS